MMVDNVRYLPNPLADRVRRDAIGFVWHEAAWAVGHLVLALGAAGLAVHGLPGVPAAVLWVLAGIGLCDALTAVRAVLSGVREVRRVRRVPGYAAAVAAISIAQEHADRVAARASVRARRARSGWVA